LRGTGVGEGRTESAPSVDRVEVFLRVGETSTRDREELSSLTVMLREELLDLDVDDVRPVIEGAAPPGSKAIEVAALGALVVSLVKSPKVLLGVVRAIAGWVERSGARSVRVQIGTDVLEVTGISSEDQRAVIASWIERQSAGTT